MAAIDSPEYSSDVIESRLPLAHVVTLAHLERASLNWERKMQLVFTKTEPPQWLLDMWREIDHKTFGKGFD